MNGEQLAAIEARAAAATEGPWRATTLGNGAWWVSALDPHGEYVGDLALAKELDGRAKANAVLMAHARTDVPDLIAEVRRLRAELEEIQNSDWRGEDQ